VPSGERRSFYIDFHSRRDHYRGRIMLLGSDRRRILYGVDAAGIGEFISQNLPPLPRKSAAAALFEEVRLVQRGRAAGIAEPLKAWRHFRVIVHWSLPGACTPPEEFNEADDTYAAQAWILDEEQKNIVAGNAEGGALRPGGGVDEIAITMDALPPGAYAMHLQLVWPAGRLKENTCLCIRVEA
jgi:hypothetical protein